MSTLIHSYIYLSLINTIQTLTAEEMYYGISFPRAKQCKTIHDELTTFIARANFTQWIQKWNEIPKEEILKNNPIVWLKNMLV